MRWLAGILVTLLMVLHTLPYLVRDQVVIWLRDQGVEEVRLGALQLNWFNGRLQIRDFYAASEGREPLQLERFSLKLNYAALADQRLLVDQLLLVGLKGGISQQDDQLWLGPLDLNQFAGDTEEPPVEEEAPAEPSNWSAGIANVSFTELEWKAHLDKQQHQLQLDQLALNHIYLWDQQRQTELLLKGRFNQAPFDIDTKAVPLPEHKTSAVKLKLDGFPLHSVTAAFEPRFKGLLDLDLNLSANLQGRDGEVKPKGLIRLRNISWSDEAISLKQKQLSWQGDLALTLADFKPTRVKTDSGLSLKGISLKQEQQRLKLADLSWKGELDMALQDNLPQQLQAKGKLALAQLKAAMNDSGQSAELAQLDWQLGAELSFKEGQPVKLASDHAISLQGIKAADKQRVVTASALKLNADVASADLKKFNVKLPQLQLDKTAVQGSGEQLIALAQLKLNQLALAHTDQIKLQQLSLNGLEVAGKSRHLSRLQSLQVKQLQLSEMKLLQIKQVLLQDSDSWVRLSKEKQLSDVEWLKQQLGLASADAADAASTKPEASADAKTEAKSEAPPMRVQLGELLVSGSNKVHIRDRSVKPTFKSDIDLQRFRVANIDTATVQSSPFDLKAKLDAFASLTASGEIELMGEQHNGHWQANIEDMALPNVSPYALQYTGYYVRSGQLNLDASGTISKGVVDANNKIRINRLDVEPGDKDKMAEFSKRLTMPLETAISVLQDSRDNIKLDVPVQGPLDKLDFGYQSVINLLAKKGVKKAAMSYLSKALQPYGLLISLASTAMDARDNGTFITLQPVGFAAGSSKLDSKATDYLSKIVGMMKEREALRLNICGAAAPSDAKQLKPVLLAENKKRKKPLPADQIQEMLEQQLHDLAQKRGEQVKQRLLQEVKADRLYTCFVQLDSDLDPEAKPEVKLGL